MIDTNTSSSAEGIWEGSLLGGTVKAAYAIHISLLWGIIGFKFWRNYMLCQNVNTLISVFCIVFNDSEGKAC